MKRTFFTAAMTLVVILSTAATSQACLCLPWLNPFAWLGFHGCGYGGCGGGYQTYGYQQPMYGAYQLPIYAAPQMLNYPIAPTAPGCGCTTALPQQQMMSAVQVPVTSYRAVTQYVPQTTYQTQYRYTSQPTMAYTQPSVAHIQSIPAYSQPTANHGAYSYGTAYESPAFNDSTTQHAMPGGPGLPPTMTYPSPPAPVYSAPTIFQPTQNIATPMHSGDINGDHEYPSQSAVTPTPIQWYQNRNAVRPVSYGVTPVSARTYSASVR